MASKHHNFVCYFFTLLDFRRESRLRGNTLEPKMRRIVFSIAFFRLKLPGLRIDQIETENPNES